jgi:hypothetical protein
MPGASFRPRLPVHVLLLVVILACSVFSAGCPRSPLLAPTDSTITLSAASSVISIGGSTTITATVQDASGSAVENGTMVYFQTTLGNLGSPQARTSGGQAATVLNAGSQTGTASLTATSGSATSNAVEVEIGSQWSASLTASTTTPAVDSDVLFTATISPSTGAPTISQYQWDFGDPYSSTNTVTTYPPQNTATHRYTVALGSTTVTLTVVAADNSTRTAQITITVQ